MDFQNVPSCGLAQFASVWTPIRWTTRALVNSECTPPVHLLQPLPQLHHARPFEGHSKVNFPRFWGKPGHFSPEVDKHEVTVARTRLEQPSTGFSRDHVAHAWCGDIIPASIPEEYDFLSGIGAFRPGMRLTAPMPWGGIVFLRNTRLAGIGGTPRLSSSAQPNADLTEPLCLPPPSPSTKN